MYGAKGLQVHGGWSDDWGPAGNDVGKSTRAGREVDTRRSLGASGKEEDRREERRGWARLAIIGAVVLSGAVGPYCGVRVGEAAHLGPYSYGGASSSLGLGVGLDQEKSTSWESDRGLGARDYGGEF